MEIKMIYIFFLQIMSSIIKNLIQNIYKRKVVSFNEIAW